MEFKILVGILVFIFVLKNMYGIGNIQFLEAIAPTINLNTAL